MRRTGTGILNQQQHGSALIVSLMILLVMTIVGVTTLNSTMMQEKMASNSHDMITTFQAAEAAIGHGISEASAVDAPYFEEALTADKNGSAPPDRSIDLDNGATTAKSELESYPPSTPVSDTSTDRIVHNKMHHINSSMGIFVGYSMRFKGTGEITATGAKSINIQGVVKGPYPAQ